MKAFALYVERNQNQFPKIVQRIVQYFVFFLYKMNLILYNLDFHCRIQVLNEFKVYSTRWTIILHVLIMIIGDFLIYILDNRYVLFFFKILLFFVFISHIARQLYNYCTIVQNCTIYIADCAKVE